MKRLVLIDSNEARAKSLAERFIQDGTKPEIYKSIADLIAKRSLEKIDLVVVDWKSAPSNFSEFVVDVNKNNKKVSIVSLGTSDDKSSEIAALDNGSDDYCSHPVIDNRVEESRYGVLISRIEARMRFGGTNVIDVGDLVIDPDEEKIYYKNEEIELKGKPFEVLTHLAKYKDQIVSKEQLLDAIWEEPELVTPNVIEVAINQIRQKLDKPLDISTIETVRRRGYRFCFPNCSGQTILDR